jgi:hypothetical protein
MEQMEIDDAYLNDIEYLDGLDYADNSECAIEDSTDLDFSLYYM